MQFLIARQQEALADFDAGLRALDTTQPADCDRALQLFHMAYGASILLLLSLHEAQGVHNTGQLLRLAQQHGHLANRRGWVRMATDWRALSRIRSAEFRAYVAAKLPRYLRLLTELQHALVARN